GRGGGGGFFSDPGGGAGEGRGGRGASSICSRRSRDCASWCFNRRNVPSYSCCVTSQRANPSSVLVGAVGLVLYRALGLRLVLIDNSLQTRDVLQQTLGAQPQEVIADLRILEVDFEQPVVGDGQHLPILGAFERLRTPVVGCEKTKFAYEPSGRELDTQFGHQEFSGHCEEHFIGAVPFAE